MDALWSEATRAHLAVAVPNYASRPSARQVTLQESK
jgi:hypothetical protein